MRTKRQPQRSPPWCLVRPGRRCVCLGMLPHDSRSRLGQSSACNRPPQQFFDATRKLRAKAYKFSDGWIIYTPQPSVIVKISVEKISDIRRICSIMTVAWNNPKQARIAFGRTHFAPHGFLVAPGAEKCMDTARLCWPSHTARL